MITRAVANKSSTGQNWRAAHLSHNSIKFAKPYRVRELTNIRGILRVIKLLVGYISRFGNAKTAQRWLTTRRLELVTNFPRNLIFCSSDVQMRIWLASWNQYRSSRANWKWDLFFITFLLSSFPLFPIIWFYIFRKFNFILSKERIEIRYSVSCFLLSAKRSILFGRWPYCVMQRLSSYLRWAG